MTKHIKWYVNVGRWNPTREEWLSLTSSVAEDEVNRINCFVYQDDLKSSLIGRALIRTFLAHITKISSNIFKLTRTEHGRPKLCVESESELKSSLPKRFDFNVSHSGDYCILGGVWSCREEDNYTIGVDITKIVRKNTQEELNRFLDLMSRREFTKREWEIIERAPNDSQKCLNFTRLWCLKESFIKSVGLGLKFGLGRISFELNPRHKLNITTELLKQDSMISDTKVLVDDEPAHDWRFLEAALDNEHLIAVGYNLRNSEYADFELDESPFEQVSVESLIEALTPITKPIEDNWVKFSARLRKTKSL